jgi:mono/diheme cytochrome c family protein
VFLLIQLVPYGRNHTNPPVTASPKWQGAQTEQLFSSSCADCHSNLTDWWWASKIAPASWLIQSDVDEGRSVMNVSNWDQPQPELDELVEQINEGEMPPSKYTILHPNAKLSDSEKQALVDGLTATYAADPPGGIK